MANIIHIFGASGSGTTTLARVINETFGHTHLDTDDYFWTPTDPPYTTKRTPYERQELLKVDIAKNEKCVISGSLCGRVSVNRPTPSKDRGRIVYYSLLGILQFTGIELDQGNS